MKKLQKTLALLFIFLIFIAITSNVIAAPVENQPVEIYKPKTTWYPPGVQYGRIIELQHNGSANGTLLATCEKTAVDNGMKYLSFPIFKSIDKGSTWTRISDVTTSEMEGMRWEPQLFELPISIGINPAGTILCAGLAITNTYGNYTWEYGKIKLFKSNDLGLTWTFMSDIAQGGADPYGIWEPFLIIDSTGKLVCFYADERQSESHSQMIVHQISSDGGYTWGPVVEDVAVNTQNLRPGMPTVSKLPNGKYFMTYEVVDAKDRDSGNPVYYRFSDNCSNWGDATNLGTKLVSQDGVTPGSSPYNVWSPAGGGNGMLIVSACFQTPSSERGSDNFVNYNLGNGQWERISQPLTYSALNGASNGYSRSMFVSADGKELYNVCNVNYNTAAHSKLVYALTYLVKNNNSSIISSNTSQSNSSKSVSSKSTISSITSINSVYSSNTSEISSNTSDNSSGVSNVLSQSIPDSSNINVNQTENGKKYLYIIIIFLIIAAVVAFLLFKYYKKIGIK